MRPTNLWMVFAASLVAAAAGCQVVAGLETRNADPIASGCALPSKGAAQIRIANLVPGATSADVCVRPSGTSDWGRPILRNGGTGATCQAGLAYTSVTVPFFAPSKRIDIKAIPAGRPCSEAATSQVTGVTLGDAVTTIALMGGGSANVPEVIKAFPEESMADQSGLRLRVINAMPGSGPIELGTAQVSDPAQLSTISLPAQASAVLFQRPVPFGATESAGATNSSYSVDAQGYLAWESGGFAFVLVPENQTKGLVAWYQPGGAFTKTLYAVGDPQDVSYPVRGLNCDDDATSNAPDGGSTSSLFASCTLTGLPNFTIDTISLGLFGGNTTAEIRAQAARLPDASERRRRFRLPARGERTGREPRLRCGAADGRVDPRLQPDLAARYAADRSDRLERKDAPGDARQPSLRRQRSADGFRRRLSVRAEHVRHEPRLRIGAASR